MLSAALLIRKWSTERARSIRRSFSKQDSSFSENTKHTHQFLGTQCSVAEKISHLCIYIRENAKSEEQLGEQVVYKDDELRFSQRFTMKLKTFSLYTFVYLYTRECKR